MAGYIFSSPPVWPWISGNLIIMNQINYYIPIQFFIALLTMSLYPLGSQIRQFRFNVRDRLSAGFPEKHLPQPGSPLRRMQPSVLLPEGFKSSMISSGSLSHPELFHLLQRKYFLHSNADSFIIPLHQLYPSSSSSFWIATLICRLETCSSW